MFWSSRRTFFLEESGLACWWRRTESSDATQDAPLGFGMWLGVGFIDVDAEGICFPRSGAPPPMHVLREAE